MRQMFMCVLRRYIDSTVLLLEHFANFRGTDRVRLTYWADLDGQVLVDMECPKLQALVYGAGKRCSECVSVPK